jgi:hypothetical protein
MLDIILDVLIEFLLLFAPVALSPGFEFGDELLYLLGCSFFEDRRSLPQIHQSLQLIQLALPLPLLTPCGLAGIGGRAELELPHITQLQRTVRPVMVLGVC